MRQLILEIKNVDNGILNSNFCIVSKNKKYILRIYEANRTLDEEKQELILLDKIASFIPVSVAIKNIDNEYISVFNNKRFALFEYINGNVVSEIDTHIIREIAMKLGKLHSFSKDFSFEEGGHIYKRFQILKVIGNIHDNPELNK